MVPSGVPLKDPDMSLDLRLRLDSDGSEFMAVCSSVPLGLDGATGPAITDVYVAPPQGDPGCRLPTAACSPVTDEFAGSGIDPAPGAGCLLAGP